MAKYVRYALSSVCFAASVACLALWWRNVALIDVVHAATVYVGSKTLSAEVVDGKILAASAPRRPTDHGWSVDSFRLDKDQRVNVQRNILRQQGQFGSIAIGVYCPCGIRR